MAIGLYPVYALSQLFLNIFSCDYWDISKVDVQMTEKKYRLVTRADFDGVVSGSLLMERGLIKEVVFAHPREIQQGSFDVTGGDILANLPYAEAAHLCFDHHASESYRVGEHDNLILDPDLPSTARVIFNHFGGASEFPDISEDMMNAVDKADSADFTIEEILTPEGWVLLNFVLDPRTGLEDFKDFAVSRDAFMIDMISFCRRNPVDEILNHPDVEERVTTFIFHNEFAELQLSRCVKIHGKTVIADFRNEEKRYPGNRFMIYALFPDCSLSIQVSPGSKPGMTEIAAGKSIIDRTSAVNVGQVMLEYGGGGHTAAGTCQVEDAEADRVLSEILDRIDTANAAT